MHLDKGSKGQMWVVHSNQAATQPYNQILTAVLFGVLHPLTFWLTGTMAPWQEEVVAGCCICEMKLRCHSRMCFCHHPTVMVTGCLRHNNTHMLASGCLLLCACQVAPPSNYPSHQNDTHHAWGHWLLEGNLTGKWQFPAFD
eukprot:GHRR01034747.1.p1 GENE.GHRR01034747.1~~GHRR01034747.1.p1  ORF type:complete len:142 (-),score=2.83 GHRR01034747.1:130-555(-)